MGSLKQLNALLTNTFKGSVKIAGSTQSSDNESANTNVPSIPLTIGEEHSTKPIELESDLICQFDEKAPSSNLTAQVGTHPESNVSSTVSLKSTQPIISQHENQISNRFDPLLSVERTSVETDTFPITASNDLAEIKMMIADINKTLITRMNNIETKIDEHNNQATQINTILTATVLPTVIELAAIISEIPHSDPRIRNKLEEMQKHIQLVQQQKKVTMKDLMEM